MSNDGGTGRVPPDGKAPRLGADFGTRVMSGIAMAGVALLATWLGGWAFALLVAAGCVILSWEWASMTRADGMDAAFWVSSAAMIAMIVALMLGLTLFNGPLWLGFWLLGALAVPLLSASDGRNRALFGFDYIALPSIALLWFRLDPVHGLAAVAFLFAVVWGTDILAYVCGRFFGGPKLWPAVSPKKTWSGAIGGTAAAVLGGVFIASMVSGASVPRLALIALVLSVISQIGDLAESAIKRKFDIKDSSGLIPGHGGLLDRVDGLLFAAFAAGLYALLAGPVSAPGRTLLIGG